MIWQFTINQILYFVYYNTKPLWDLAISIVHDDLQFLVKTKNYFMKRFDSTVRSLLSKQFRKPSTSSLDYHQSLSTLFTWILWSVSYRCVYICCLPWCILMIPCRLKYIMLLKLPNSPSRNSFNFYLLFPTFYYKSMQMYYKNHNILLIKHKTGHLLS